MDKISIIVPTKNEEKNIENCLKSIKNQSYKNTEIIVVDNNSDDKTKGIAKNYTDQVFNAGPERSSQRNFGAKKSTGKYLLFIDADMIISNHLVEECIQICKINRKLIGLYIPEKIVGEGLWIKVRNFERSFYNGTVVDAVRFMNRGPFMEVGGFDNNLIACEDWDLGIRLNKIGDFGIIDAPLYHNEGKFDITKYLNKKNYYIRDLKDNYQKKWSRNNHILKKQFGIYYRFIGIFIEKGKWIKLLTHPVLSILMIYLRFRLAINYIQK